jgi:hypothetical protein
MWISFEEQKPINNQVVFVRFNYNHSIKIIIQFSENSEYQYELSNNGTLGRSHPTSEFSHWMDYTQL